MEALDGCVLSDGLIRMWSIKRQTEFYRLTQNPVGQDKEWVYIPF